MCGIAGIFNLCSKNRITIHDMQKMISAVHHRGPDEFGLYIDNDIGLAHARLSIIDLTTGTQPIHNEDKSLWISFNGEIYNYLELKSELVKKGHKFYTTSDTEVILHCYEEYGREFLNYLNGQFAFAIWNNKRKELLLARDRFGIIPLHYYLSKDQLIFASEIKSIFTHNSVERRISNKALNELLTYWTTLPGNTFFENIKEIPAGNYLIINRQKTLLKKYYDLPYYNNNDKLDWSLDRISDEINNELYNSVKIRLRSDVPVGSYLSGGLDSSILATIVKNNFNDNLKTYGIRFTNKKYDEGEYQDQVVKNIKTDHNKIVADNENISRNFSKSLWYIEKPLLRTAPIPLYLLSKKVHDNKIKVVLTGEGADEFFGGYNIFREAKVRWFWSRNTSSTLRSKLLKKIYPYIFTDERLTQLNINFFKNVIENFSLPHFSHLIRWSNSRRIRNFINTDLITDENEYIFPYPENFNERDYFEKTQYLEVNTFLSGYLLSSQGDRVAMANSIEIRFPFLDHNLVNLLAKIPSRFKIYGMNEKYLLKRSYKNILPKSIINRSKQPYRAPIEASLLSNSNNELHENISKIAIQEVGIFNYEKIEKLFKKFEKNKVLSEIESMAILYILSTQMIYKKFIKNINSSFTKLIEFDLVYDFRK